MKQTLISILIITAIALILYWISPFLLFH